jgi:hypothetical protein
MGLGILSRVTLETRSRLAASGALYATNFVIRRLPC